jgi:putative inorganic carbon (HCO3(-)) transporter
MIALSFVAVLSSWSRSGLLSLGVVTVLLVWHSRRKWFALPLLFFGIGLMAMTLPEQWFIRMGTLGTPELDDSAQSRLDVWRLGWAYALLHPWLGGGFEGWIYLSLPQGGSRDWHSAFVEMAAEHGLYGLALWCTLVFGSLASLTRLIWINRRWRLPWLSSHAEMLRAALAAYTVGAVFLGIAYWELLFLLIVSAILLERFARLERSKLKPLTGHDFEKTSQSMKVMPVSLSPNPSPRDGGGELREVAKRLSR